MEETQVVIVGAGPSGLALAVNLSKMGIDTIILERGCGVTEDPRGIAISSDAVRNSYQLGIGNALTTKIGQTIGAIHFHYGSFQTKPFGSFDHDRDWMEQSLPLAVLQFQPNFESELRKIIADSPHCELREQCEVFESSDSCDGVIVGYQDHNGDGKHVRGEFLVGADGKTGVVRKKFWSPLESNRKLDCNFNYQETWVASNLQIIPPTPESHPDFPLWKLGYTPDEVCDAFWPTGFHFCNDLARPSVSGPFGPKKERFWRHEYSVIKGDSVEDPLEDFLKNFQPWLIRPASHFKGKIQANKVAFPDNCVKIIRCGAFNFAHKVVNRWFHNRTLIIGDAAHVFPPFGGQGIAAGLRDALALSWRLNLLLKLPGSPSNTLLRGWQNEQRQRVDEAARATMRNASLTVERSWLRAWLARLVMRLVALVPGAHGWVSRRRLRDKAVLRECAEGFFVAARGGGARVGQIWVRPYCGSPVLSDKVFFRRAGSLAVVVLLDGRKELEKEVEEVEGLLGRAAVDEELVSLAAVTFLMRTGRRLAVERKDAERYSVYLPCSGEELIRAVIEPIGGYDESSFEKRLGSKAKYVVVRPDCFVHSVAVTGEEFLQNLSLVQETLSR